MKKMMPLVMATLVLAAGMMTTDFAQAEQTKVPASITTPDKVNTRIGTLEFFDGIPTKKTARLCYDKLWRPGEIELVK